MKTMKYMHIIFFLLPFIANAQISVLRTAQVAGSGNNTAGNYSAVVTLGQTALGNQFSAGNYTGSIGFLSAMQSTNEIHFTDYPTQGELYIIVLQQVLFEQAGITLQVGDEVGIYDGNTLVGHGKYTGSYPLVANCHLADATLGIPGAISGNEILFKLWRAEDDTEYDAVPTISSGGHFGNMPATNVSVLTVQTGIDFTYQLQANKLHYICRAASTETDALPAVFGGFSPDYMQGNGQLFWPASGLTTMDFVATAGYKYFHSANAEFILSGGALTGGQTINVPGQSIVFIPYPYSLEHTFAEVFGGYAQITYLSDNTGVYIPEWGVNTIVPKPGVAFKAYAIETFSLVYPVLTNSTKNSSVKNQQYVEGSTPINKSGEVYVVVFNNVKGLSIGDEVLAYSNGDCYGSTVYKGQTPFFIQTYVENTELGVSGANLNSNIELFVKHQGSNSLEVLEADFKQGGLYGAGMYSVADIASTTGVPDCLLYNFDMKVYPNPFTTQVTISFSIPADYSKTNLLITDISGRLIESVERFGTGTNQYVWDAGDSEDGVFFCKLLVDNVPVATQKLVLIK